MSRDELIQQSPRVGAPIQEVRAWVSAYFLYRGHKVNTDNIMWDGRQLRSLSRQALYGAIKEHTDLSDRDSDHASFDIKEILSTSNERNVLGVTRKFISNYLGQFDDRYIISIFGLCLVLIALLLFRAGAGVGGHFVHSPNGLGSIFNGWGNNINSITFNGDSVLGKPTE
ncbi:hypothetical protein MGN70_012276 [Eutypa lata]|nr:hypothetical protein MGN70_012276 [Eutypa lata]